MNRPILQWTVSAIMCVLILWPAPGQAQSREALLERAERLNQQVIQLYQRGQYAQAIPLSKEALRIREQALGPTHPDVATSLNNLALLVWDAGEPRQAATFLARAVSIAERHT